MVSETVVVPPGHKVVVITPTEGARVVLAPSGFVVLDYGRRGGWQNTHTQFDAVRVTSKASTVVILQREVIEDLKRSNGLVKFMAYWKQAKENGVSAVWVLPLGASEHTSVISSIREVGYGVHASAPDGACFVEVHKPDGSIVIGMPGPVV